jgi:FkbM family methyltransferase
MQSFIFVDVGGHLGQSVEVALSPAWRFDHVHTFEPDPECVSKLETKFAVAIASGRLTVHQAALSDHDGYLMLFGDNQKGGASVISGALSESGTPLQVRAIDVNRFIESLGGDVRLYIKLNCEGGEVAILDRLCAAAPVATIAAIVADFDVVKTGFGYFEKRRIVGRAKAKGLPMALAEEVMAGETHASRLANWLSYHPEVAAFGTELMPKRQPLKRRVRYALRDMRSAVGLNAAGYKRSS